MKKLVLFFFLAILNSCSNNEDDIVDSDIGWFFTVLNDCKDPSAPAATNYCVSKKTYDYLVNDYPDGVSCEYLVFTDINGVSQSGYVVAYGFSDNCENYKSF